MNPSAENRLLVVLAPPELRAEPEFDCRSIDRVEDLAAHVDCHVHSMCAAKRPVSNLYGLVDRIDTRMADVARQQRQNHQRPPLTLQKPALSTRALLRAAERHAIDMIVKTCEVHNASWLNFNHLDFNLLRRATVPVWFAKTPNRSIRRIVVATGRQPASTADGFIEHKDYEAFAAAQALAQRFGAEVTALHIVQSQSTTGLPAYDISSNNLIEYPTGKYPFESHVSGRHSNEIATFRSSFNLTPDEFVVRPGDTVQEVCRYASEVSADLVVLSAAQMTRWQRALKPGLAEKLLSALHSDVLVWKSIKPTTRAA